MIIFGLIASFQNIIMANVVQTLTNIATNKNWGKIAQFLIIVIAPLVVTLIASLVFNRLKTNTIKETNTYLRTHILGSGPQGQVNDTGGTPHAIASIITIPIK